jgi:hypothetical protein
MYRPKIVCPALFSLLLIATVCCQIGYSEYNMLAIDDLPGVGESLVIDTNSILTVNARAILTFRQLALSCRMEGRVFVLQEVRLKTCSRSVPLACRSVCTFCIRFRFRIYRAQFG